MRILVMLLLFAAQLSGQPAMPVFRATTQLVEFTFIAIDKHGKAVTDLRPEEVLVYEGGQSKELAFFRFEGAPAIRQQAKPLPPGIFSNRMDYSPGPPRNISALVLDTLNTEPADMMWVRAQVIRYLRRLAPQTRVAVFLLGTQLSILHDFTEDTESLRARIEKAVLPVPGQKPTDIDALARDAEQMIAMFPEDPQLVEMLRNQIEVEGLYNAATRQRRTELTLAALETLGQHLAGIPGRKNMIWIGGGISMLNITGAMGFGPHGGFQGSENLVRQAAQSLAQKGVALYAVDSRPLELPKEMSVMISTPQPARGRGRFAPQQQAEEISADPLPAAYNMAAITGGQVITNTNDPAEGLERAARDLLGAYSIAFYSPGDPDGKWHKLKLKVKRSGVQVRHREGFLSIPAPATLAPWSGEQWSSAVQNSLVSTSISLDARCEPAAAAESGSLFLQLQVDPAQLYFHNLGSQQVAELEIGIAEKSSAKTIRLFRESGTFDAPVSPAGGNPVTLCRYAKTWKPSEGTSSLRIIVRDKATGRFGTLDLPMSQISGESISSRAKP